MPITHQTLAVLLVSRNEHFFSRDLAPSLPPLPIHLIEWFYFLNGIKISIVSVWFSSTPAPILRIDNWFEIQITTQSYQIFVFFPHYHSKSIIFLSSSLWIGHHFVFPIQPINQSIWLSQLNSTRKKLNIIDSDKYIWMHPNDPIFFIRVFLGLNKQ